ncbi:MAG: DMT family transporter [Candidatus Pelagadaptatus aseana]|uniref:DMT family transporter n=1 Tax=Candidatus Pelagadaptatus aseana TaxID=3120508 RepID=UPI0039B1C67E
MHQISGRRGLGITLALVTAFLWGVLPIALKVALQELDAYTACWVRMAVSGLLVGLFLAWRGELKPVATPSLVLLLMCAVAVFGLLGNYLFYNFSLQRLNPETAQLMIQVAPFLVMVGSVIIFHEPFSRRQIFGALLVVVGLLTFFNENLMLLLDSGSSFSRGVMLMMVSSVAWAAYALVQKKLLRTMSSMSIMLMIYIAGGLLFLPMADPAAILEMSPLPLAMLLFCCVNTVLSYGAFSESMNHIHASQVSGIITAVPVFTFVVMSVLVEFWPENFQAEELNLLAYLGAAMVVAGSALAAMAKKA